MGVPGIAGGPDNFYKDIFSQNPSTNRLYTQITLCFQISDNSLVSDSKLINNLIKGSKQLSAHSPRVAGRVVNEHDTFKIKPSEKTTCLIVKDYRNDSLVPTWHALRRANFPSSMLYECIIAPRKTLAVSEVSDVPYSELPVFLIQANFITDSLLLTVNDQHESVDMPASAISRISLQRLVVKTRSLPLNFQSAIWTARKSLTCSTTTLLALSLIIKW